MTNLPELLRQRSHKNDQKSWRPTIYDLKQPAHRQALHALIESQPSLRVNDQILRQLRELIATRNPDRTLANEELEASVSEHLGDAPTEEYGVWVHYPWAERLTHLLAEDDFRELRTNRNRNKITDEEQSKLRSLKLGVVGLSVGQATALTLAQEEVGGHFRLADFDELDLSNLNRLRAPTYDLGIPKTVLTARGIFEINPFAEVQIFSEGITEENIDTFLTGGGNLDILFEECDSMDIKLRLRQRAKLHQIPVLMETSDRGMLDVERFDLDPERPPLHGLAAGIDASSLQKLSNKEKVPTILNLIGASTISERMAASLVEVGTTVKTWPQLASAVSLGAALNTDVARRIALKQMSASGRYYVDLESLINDDAESQAGTPQDYAVRACAEAQMSAALLSAPAQSDWKVNSRREMINLLIGYAQLAPSAGNAQPWNFSFDGETLFCFSDPERRLFDESVSVTAVGAAIENIVLVAKSKGLEARVEAYPDPGSPNLVASIQFSVCPIDPALDDIEDVIVQRVTNRIPGIRQSLDPSLLKGLQHLIESRGARLDLLTTPDELEAAGACLGAADRVRFFSKKLHADMMKEFRWSPEETLKTRDGIDVATMEMSSADLAGLKMLRSWPLMKMLMKTGGGRALENPTRKALDGASALGRLVLPGYSTENFLHGGRILQELWLRTTQLGLALQPMAGPIYFFARLEHEDGRGFSARQNEELMRLRQEYRGLFPGNADESEIMVFRLAVAPPPKTRSLRQEPRLRFTGPS